MATNLTVNSKYDGKLAHELFVEAYKKSDTLGQGAVNYVTNIIGSGYLPKLNYTGALVKYSCGFNPSGTINYNDKELVTKKFKMEEEVCKNDFHATFQAEQDGIYSAANEIPSTLEDSIINGMLGYFSQELDRQIWQGDGTTHSITGFLPKFLADSDVIDVLGITASITASNVVGEIEKVYNKIPDEIYGDPDLIIAASYNIVKKYKQAQANQQSIGNLVGDKELDYLGVKIIPIAGLGDNKMVAYRKKNLVYGCGAENDANLVYVKDMDESDLSGNIRTKLVVSFGVEYAFGDEIVYYRPA